MPVSFRGWLAAVFLENIGNRASGQPDVPDWPEALKPIDPDTSVTGAVACPPQLRRIVHQRPIAVIYRAAMLPIRARGFYLPLPNLRT